MKKIALFFGFVFLVLSLNGCATTVKRAQSPLTIIFKPEVTVWGDFNRPHPYWYEYYPFTRREILIYRNYDYGRRRYPRERRW